MSKGWPYCMKKKRSPKKCGVCGATLESLEGKTMPGFYKGKCHKDYVMQSRYKNSDLTKLSRARIQLMEEIHVRA